MSGVRLATGGVIDRAQAISFDVDGARFTGFTGDTLASALLASGQMLMGRSFKRHRPRGLLSAGPEEPNALFGVGVGGRFEPNTRATQVALYEGLTARSQNRWPSLHFDMLALLDRAAPLLPAGFYYKTFKSPLQAWRLYEHVIRALAGLGDPPHMADPDAYGERFEHADVLVVGLGLAGLAAARAAVEAGLRVIAVEQDSLVGGALFGSTARIDGAPGLEFAVAQRAKLEDLGVTVLMRTTAFGIYDHGLVGLVQRLAEPGQMPPGAIAQRLWKVRAKHIVLAAGAIERPLVFAGNDRPGVMLAQAGAVYAQRFAVAVGQSAILVAGSDSDYDVLNALREAGVRVSAVLDHRPIDTIGADARAAANNIAPLYSDATVAKTYGARSVEAIVFRTGAENLKLDCDALLCAGGWTPTLHLHAHALGGQRFDPSLGVFVPDGAGGPVRAAGACNGAASPEACWNEGWRAGADTAASCGRTQPPNPAPCFDAPLAAHAGFAAPPQSAPARSKIAFVDFQNDVTVADIALAHQEGYESVEHLKRYTTLGMGTDQGKTSNLTGLRALAMHRGVTPDAIGLTTYRPPFTPVTLAALARGHSGAHLEPLRRSPVFAALQESGAQMQTSGLWLRPRYFSTGGESLEEAARREAFAVRTRVGLTDASTFGKFEITGPDAAAFLDLVYATAIKSIKVGKARYAVMLNDDGRVFDDGTIWRIDEQCFFVTASTARTSAVLQRLEYFRDVVTPHLTVDVCDVSEAWSAFVVAGPGSRTVVSGALSLMRTLAPQDVVATDDMRIARISYSGEHAYEVYLRPEASLGMWRVLESIVSQQGGALYGLEALEWLRVEKGHIAVGAEIDGRTTADDLGLKRWVKKAPHAGAVGASLPALLLDDRLRLVGLCSQTGASIPEGAPLVDESGVQCGRVTSSAFGVGVGAHIALGLLKNGRARHGEILSAASATRKRHVRVQVTDACAYDSAGARLG
jgi:heterotetrameric sarcosine oxidase alpha subunit